MSATQEQEGSWIGSNAMMATAIMEAKDGQGVATPWPWAVRLWMGASPGPWLADGKP